MAYENNGTARSLYFTVNKQVGGNNVIGYPHTYNGQNSWGDVLYPTLSDNQFRQLSDGDFAARYAAFVSYVEGIESGLDFATDIVGNGATKYDPSNCGITTTTTAGVPPVYAFSVKYGKYPVDTCNGTDTVIYSGVQVPVANTILYKDAALTQKWNTTNGEHILFVSPVIYGQKAVSVSLISGKIISVTTFLCGSGITPDTPISHEAGLANDVAELCAAPVSLVYTKSPATFTTGSVLYADLAMTIILTGYTKVIHSNTGIIYNLNSSTGVIGSATGDAC